MVSSATSKQRRNKTDAGTTVKGYAVIRVSLSLPRNGDVFMFVKEHRAGNAGGKGSAKSDKNSSNSVLFVANAPLVPRVRTDIFLHALFSRFGEVERVAVVENPINANNHDHDSANKRSNDGASSSSSSSSWERSWSGVETTDGDFGFGDKDPCDEGRFAHVVFASPGERRRALRETTTMTEAIVVDDAELSRLATESSLGRDDDDAPTSAVARLASRRRARVVPRDALSKRCDAAVERFETAEEAQIREQRRLAAGEPDEDGFVTVTHNRKNVKVVHTAGSKRTLEEEGYHSAFGAATLESDVARRNRKRSRTRKKRMVDSSGNNGLDDFYRFQTREAKKKSIEELRERFEQDLAAVKKMKEQKMYRPFTAS